MIPPGQARHAKRFDTAPVHPHNPAMQAIQFEQAVGSILKRDKRFDPHAYLFLKDALDFTLRRIADGNGGQPRHVSGPELVTGFRDLALEQFGPMGATLMNEWGVRKCGDIGDMVFHLIEEQVFGKQESDCHEDFAGSFDLEDSLRSPFVPKSPLRPTAPAPPTPNPLPITRAAENLKNS